MTGGNGSITGQEVQFNVNFTTPFRSSADHYFFVPQVQVSGGEFFWLSGDRPNSSFPVGFTDLQSWTRDAALDPDWSRIGTDIVGPVNGVTPTFNAAFSLDGVETPLPAALPLFATGLGALGLLGWRRKRKAAARRLIKISDGNSERPPRGGLSRFLWAIRECPLSGVKRT